MDSEIIELIRAKSHARKMFFSVRNGRKQMSMLLDGPDEGERLVRAIGGKCGRKVRSKPVGAWEWYYHGDGLLDLCRAILPSLNGYQQKIVGEWLDAHQI